MSSTLPNFSPSITDDEYSLFESPNLTGSPERRLLLAVLERAILDYVGNDPKEVAEAQEWIFGEVKEPSYSEFSFPWVCQELDLDTASIANTIEAMPKRGNHKIAPWYFSKHDDPKKAKGKACRVMKGNFPHYH
jgi:hypothetical protein